MGRLDGKVSIVTGGASPVGLGFAIGRRFLEEGATVVLTDVSPGVKDRVSNLSPDARVMALHHDVQSEGAWIDTFATVVDAFGQVDIVVNNAGTTRRDPIDEMSLDTWHTIVQTNLTGTFLGCKHAVTEMRRHGGGGTIVNIASINGVIAMRWAAAYSSSKGGIRSLTKVVALETAREAIRCNVICPGLIESDIHAGVRDRAPEMHAKLVDAIPMGRLGDPADIASAAVYLASDEARYVTGAELIVDGGYTAE